MCRLSIGIEDLDDITHDLRQALDSALNAAKTTEVGVCLLLSHSALPSPHCHVSTLTSLWLLCVHAEA
jgi:hypothetical protein